MPGAIRVWVTGFRVYCMLQVLKEHPGPISVKEISDITKFTVDDITNTLKHLGMIQFHKGQHVICALDDVIDKCGAPVDMTLT